MWWSSDSTKSRWSGSHDEIDHYGDSIKVDDLPTPLGHDNLVHTTKSIIKAIPLRSMIFQLHSIENAASVSTANYTLSNFRGSVKLVTWFRHNQQDTVLSKSIRKHFYIRLSVAVYLKHRDNLHHE